MRKLILFNMITLDGYFEGPNRDISWHNVDAEFNEFAIKQLDEADLLVFGRVTYELMASYWPTESALKDDPTVAGKMNAIPKIVVSRTMSTAGWHNTTLIRENVTAELSKVKQKPGKNIFVFGSAQLFADLLKSDLIDEVRVIINPLLLGRGTQLFRDVQKKINLKLIRSKPFRSGNVLLEYAVSKDPR